MRSMSGPCSRAIAPLAVGLLYAALIGLVHLNVLAGFDRCTIGATSLDKYLHLWDFWWGFKSAVELHSSFFFTPYMYYPPGMSLWQGNSGFLLNYFAIPFRLVTDNPLVIYNISVLLSVWLSAVGGYVLIRLWVKRRWAAFVGGLFLALNPLVVEQIDTGYIEFANLGFAWGSLGGLGSQPPSPALGPCPSLGNLLVIPRPGPGDRGASPVGQKPDAGFGNCRRQGATGRRIRAAVGVD